MTTYNTGNPIGSTDARDRLDNSENLDLAVNSLSMTFVDRLGRTRDTLEGIYQKSAYYRAGTFDAGYTLTNNRQTLAYGNIEYSWSGSFGENGKQVPPLSTPETTGGVGAGAWVDRTNLTLRGEISDIDGAGLIGSMSYAQLRVYSGSQTTVNVWGISNIFDGAAGTFKVNAGDTTSTDNGGTILVDTLGRRWYRIFNGPINVLWFGAKANFSGTTGTDDAHAFNKAFNTAAVLGKLVFVPAGAYAVGSSLSIPDNCSGLYGEGERTQLFRTFTGGGLVVKDNASNLPLILRDFAINCSTAITPVSGDYGIKIGLSADWSGRGDISNILVMNQYIGVYVKGGTSGVIKNVSAEANLSHGFLLQTFSGTLDSCLAQYNQGSNYYIYCAITAGGNPNIKNCISFCSKSIGWVFDSISSGIMAANVYIDGLISSYDNGGVSFVKPHTQVRIINSIIEYAGSPATWKPAWTNNTSAVGLSMSNVQTVWFDNLHVITPQAGGVNLTSVTKAIMSGLLIESCGQSGVGSAGLTLSACSAIQITNLNASVGGNQTTDLSINTGCSNVQISNSSIRTYYTDNSNSSLQFNTLSSALATSTTVASATNVVIPDTRDFFLITGTTSISNLTSASVHGRIITVIAASALPFSGTGNVKYTGTMSAATSKSFIWDGSFWWPL